jgi:hypothetical protein
MTGNEWQGFGLQVGPDEWRRYCIFNCETTCAAGCLPMPHLGRGRTTVYASAVDQRFSYCLYVPRSYTEYETTTYPLAVVVHGTERGPQAYRDAFADFAEEYGCIVLAPFFPCGVIELGFELHNYKFIEFHGLRFDEILLRMVDEIAGYYRIETERFLLFGFSGGGQFVHRFYYLHPRRLMGVSVGAPGWVTLLDTGRDWWTGVRDLEQQFGIPLDLEGLRSVPVQLVVGEQDVDAWDVIMPEGSRYWMPGANDAGSTRVERVVALRESLERHGIHVQQDVVPGAAHEGLKVVGAVHDFFAGVLTARRPHTDCVAAR